METKTKQYYENNVDDIAVSKEEFLVKNYNKTRTKSFLHKLGNSLGLVVVVLPVAGLFAAIGGIIMSKVTSEAGYTAGLVLADLGNTVLSNLGLLFMLAIIIGFTGNRGMAVYAGIIAYIAFIGFTVAFIRFEPVDGVYDPEKAKYFHIWFWDNIGGSGHGLDATTQLSNVLGLGQGAVNSADTNNLSFSKSTGAFIHASLNGVRTLNTGVLGGIAMGFIYVWIYNKFKDLKLPSMLAFFEGEKFVAILMILLAPVIASLFIIVWPAVNYALGYIGIGFGYIPFGFDSFFYGMFTRFLLPFEAHPAFYGPLWWTSAGGQLSQVQENIMGSMIYRIATGNTVAIGHEQDVNTYANAMKAWAGNIIGTDGTSLATWLSSNFTGKAFSDPTVLDKLMSAFQEGGLFYGAKGISASSANDIAATIKNYSQIDWTTAGDQLISIALLNKYSWFDMRDIWGAGLKATRFISGGYSLCMFIIPAIGLAMFATLDKKRRGPKFGLYFGAVLSSFLLGVTEPVEFMFAFTAPIIYFGFYAPFYGLAFLFTNLFQVKLGSTFSNGLMDYIVNAIIPSLTRQGANGQTDVALGVAQTRLWVPIIIGLIGAGIAFPLFRAIFLKFNFAAPGSLAAETGEGVSTSRYLEVKEEYDSLKDYIGGPENVLEMNMIKPTMAKLKVKYNKYVINNEFADTKLEDIVKAGSEYTIVAKDQKLGQRYLNILNLMVSMKHKQDGYKLAVQQEKMNFKDYLTGKYTIEDYKKAEKARIADFDEKDKKQRQTLRAQNAKFIADLTAKRKDVDVKAILAEHRKEMDAKLNALDEAKKTFLATEKSKEQAFIKSVKESKKSIDKKQAKEVRAKQIKSFKINKQRTEAINEVEAKWQFKQDKLLNTTDLEQLKYKYLTNMWKEQHLEERDLLKIEYKFNMKLTKQHDIKQQIKQDYKDMLKGLEFDKAEQAKKKEDYKQQVIAMKAQNKIAFKKQARE